MPMAVAMVDENAMRKQKAGYRKNKEREAQAKRVAPSILAM